ncbi:MAG: hypothetical protein PCFJNLEI_01207 [Verrucomicrobiae bacterium]|nr:hypothetical protein [Verrucomicrobiae bacterium]
MKKYIAVIAATVVAAAVTLSYAGEGHGTGHGEQHKDHEAGQTITVTGEVLDMVCYIDHGATGAKHADCAKTCIESGLPVGIKATDGKTYLLVGEHKPLNKQLAPLAAKTITVKGKAVSRDGFNMIENAEIVSK